MKYVRDLITELWTKRTIDAASPWTIVNSLFNFLLGKEVLCFDLVKLDNTSAGGILKRSKLMGFFHPISGELPSSRARHAFSNGAVFFFLVCTFFCGVCSFQGILFFWILHEVNGAIETG